LKIVPAVLDRFRRTLVGLKMPGALEVLDQTVRQLERGEASALEVDTLFAKDRGLKLPPAPTRRSHAGTCLLQSLRQHANPGTAAAPSRSAA
jgi:hypothetical protein